MFSDLSGDQKGVLLMNAAKVVPAFMGFNTAAKANARQQGYLDDIKKLEGQRQTLVNPYAKVSNPYQNLAVATRAAEMQADQTDLALANTLDQLRQTGAGASELQLFNEVFMGYLREPTSFIGIKVNVIHVQGSSQ